MVEVTENCLKDILRIVAFDIVQCAKWLRYSVRYMSITRLGAYEDGMAHWKQVIRKRDLRFSGSVG